MRRSDTWSDPRGEWVAAKAASAAWELHGLRGLGEDGDRDEPVTDRLLGEEIGYFQHT